jgi:hypothetical protein
MRLLSVVLLVALPLTAVRAQETPPPAAPAAPKEAAEDGAEKEEGPAPKAGGPEVPDDLLEDEHLREEYGVNQFTAPSIRKIFGSLDPLGSLPYDKLKRPITKDVSKDRSIVSLHLGVLIGDGFLAAQAEKIDDLETIGRAVLRHSKVLAAGARVTEHAKAILENSALGDWKTMREDLAATQKDVEAEMVLLKDMEMAHLISLGGWLRGLQIASAAALDPYSPQRAAVLARKDLAEYYAATLADLDPALKKHAHVQALAVGVGELFNLLDLPEGKSFDQERVQRIQEKVNALVQVILTAKS